MKKRRKRKKKKHYFCLLLWTSEHIIIYDNSFNELEAKYNKELLAPFVELGLLTVVEWEYPSKIRKNESLHFEYCMLKTFGRGRNWGLQPYYLNVQGEIHMDCASERGRVSCHSPECNTDAMLQRLPHKLFGFRRSGCSVGFLCKRSHNRSKYFRSRDRVVSAPMAIQQSHQIDCQSTEGCNDGARALSRLPRTLLCCRCR